MPKTSVVINTLNEEKNIELVINSVKWADEILVCDMHSEDKTVEIAKKLGARVIFHKRLGYVELVRNFAISKALGDWILVLDPDEGISKSLKERLVQIADKMRQISYVRIPRKNIIFNKWMKASGWWPDYQIRFFRKGKVKWTDQIHRPPLTAGEGLDLPVEEKFAIIHNNYQTVSQFLERLNRYTSVEAKELEKSGYKFKWSDLIGKPLSEFLSRFFVNKGYQDGLHGLALSFLQAFSFLVVYLKTWETEGFNEESVNLEELEEEKKKGTYEINYWLKKEKSGFN